MTEALHIKSAQDALVLKLGAPIGQDGDGKFRASLQGGPTAEVDVYDMHYDSLASYFEDIAANWRGWEGSKSWNSLEGHMMLDAKADRLGHVYLRVRLRAMDMASDWDVAATLLLEAGQLDNLAAEARRLFVEAVV